MTHDTWLNNSIRVMCQKKEIKVLDKIRKEDNVHIYI